jgi:anti-sigma B factor antagonist
MRGLKLDDEQRNGVWFIRCDGYLDANTAEDLDNLVAAVFRHDCYRIVFNLGDVTFISSAGAGVVMTAYKQCETNGGCAVFVNLADSVNAVFKTLGLLGVFKVLNTEEEATEFLGEFLS